jgi:Kef-type K+ transport system membrane component KefB
MPTLTILLLQLVVVLGAARITGWLFNRIGQPQVLGEMFAGIVLGPSLLGWMAPSVSAFLFPPESLGYLAALSHVGLVAFMFLVGLEVDPRLLRARGHATVVISHASIALPFVLGSLLAVFLYPRLSDDSVSFTKFSLFLGIAMSITAFPVLARILKERNLLQHPVGAMALTCAAVDDATAWCILAGVVLLVRAGEGATALWFTIGGSVVYGAVMLLFVRPLLRRFERLYEQHQRVTQNMLAVLVLLALASAWTTERLGIHALFGAFLFGAVLPRHRALLSDIREKLEDVIVVLLLPLFFALTGLRTRIGLLAGSEMWLLGALVVAVAIAGKLGGSTTAARAAGISWRQSGAIGILMNTRGLMELVVLNIGLDLGVVSPALFAMMVMMALVTTFMATPLLEVIYPQRDFRREIDVAQVELARLDAASAVGQPVETLA